MDAVQYSTSAEFLEHGERKLFSLNYQPAGENTRGAVLFLPPFTDEMHKSRRMVAWQGRMMAAAGYGVMLLDLTGCGDSGGDFVDADWLTWLQDANFAVDLLRERGADEVCLWGLRSGGLLATDVARQRSDIAQLLLWQPTLNGEQQIDQFLRIRAMAGAINDASTFDRKSLWEDLRAGHSLEIAGYELSSALALQMSAIRLLELEPRCKVNWVEIGGAPGKALSSSTTKIINHWQEAGAQVAARQVEGQPFWRTIDAVINSELMRVTLECLES